MVAGAALVGIGLAFPGPISIGNIPIITNNGQPAIQVVIGSAAKASDGVAAANIAAAIGNLAFTTSTVSPVVNTTEAQSVLHVSVSSPTYSLTNQQVWLNESASALTSGTYGFTALIGSVLNGGVQLGSPASTKTLSSSTSYTYEESNLLTTTPAPSPYTAVTYVPVGTSVSASYNGGGVSFSSFSLGSYDNLLEVSHANLPALLSGSGTNGENEYLWLTGFPVFDQASGVNNFALLDANGAYQVTFNKPIPVNVSNSINNAAFTFLGQQWTIIGYKIPNAASSAGPQKNGWNYTSNTITESTASTFTSGGYLQLAATTTPLRTVDVGSNMTSGPWMVALKDIGQATSGGYPAILEVYYKGAPVQNYSIVPPKTISVNESGNRLFIHVNQTVAGFYAYEKWAQMQLYSNVETLQSGTALNSTTNPNWNVVLQWTNSSEAAGGPLDSLQSIIVYGTPSQAETLLPGHSFNFITSPAVWKLEFVGETLGSANFDALTAKTSAQGAFKYTNPGATGATPAAIYNITEPAQELTITSQIPNAFTYQGQTSSSITYDLTPYEVNNNANTVSKFSTTLNTYNSVVTATFPANYITTSATLQLQVTGYEANAIGGATSVQQSPTFTFNGASGATTQSFNIPIPFYNVSSIAITNNHAIPGLTVKVFTENSVAASNTVDLADLVEASSPYIVYTPSGKTIPSLAPLGTINYNQQNGQTPEPFTISGSPATQSYTQSSVAPSAWYEYTMSELAVPTNSLAVDSLSFDIVNSTGGATASPFFQLNYSGTASGSKGTQNNMTYQPSNTTAPVFSVSQGFRTEKGSKIASITPTALTVDFAKTTDMLQFAVAPVNTTVSKSYSLQGPYGIGQATNIPNVSIGKVTANITLSGTSGYTITGISNITANPVTTSTPVLLKSLSSTAPLAILDSQGVQNSPYILVGSGYVNSLSAALQSAYNITMTPSTQIVQAYGNRILVAGYYANETTAAANQFINELYQQAASTT
jgi:hypothetical protein